ACEPPAILTVAGLRREHQLVPQHLHEDLSRLRRVPTQQGTPIRSSVARQALDPEQVGYPTASDVKIGDGGGDSATRPTLPQPSANGPSPRAQCVPFRARTGP